MPQALTTRRSSFLQSSFIVERPLNDWYIWIASDNLRKLGWNPDIEGQGAIVGWRESKIAEVEAGLTWGLGVSGMKPMRLKMEQNQE